MSATVGAWAFSTPLSRIRAPEVALARCSKKLLNAAGYLDSFYSSSHNHELRLLAELAFDKPQSQFECARADVCKPTEMNLLCAVKQA